MNLILVIIIFSIAILAIIYFIIKLINKIFSYDNNSGDDLNSETNILPSDGANEIAKKITNKKEFNKLESRLNIAEKKLINSSNDKAYDKAVTQHELLEEAYLIASSKILSWQFVPSLSLNSDKAILEIAYKEFSIDEYKNIRKKIGGEDYEWISLTAEDELEDPESYLKSLQKFREIIESTIGQADKIKKINELVKNNKTFANEFFDMDSDLKPGDQWFVDELASHGLPQAEELYKEGYQTPKSLLDLSIEEFSKRKGIGPKKLEQFRNFHELVSNLDSDFFPSKGKNIKIDIPVQKNKFNNLNTNNFKSNSNNIKKPVGIITQSISPEERRKRDREALEKLNRGETL